jgi:hypothetical protein
MSEILQWSSGLNGYKKHILDKNHFTTELSECQFEPGRNLDDIFYDHLIDRPNSPVELLYSGGLDSELVLMSLVKNKIPVEAMTMVITIKGAILNVVDLYYSEKFCRENNVKQNLFYLDADELYNSDKYLEYLLPYNIIEPHVASHFWLIEQCHNYPIIGGDWPWLQTHVNPRVLSPYRLDFMAGELFMRDSGIHGINNMISHSLDSCRLFVNEHYKMFLKHQELDTTWSKIGFFKQEMFEGIGVKVEPRVKAYGWEVLEIHPDLFDMNPIREDLFNRVGEIQHVIKWNSVIGQAAEMPLSQNDTFK